MFDPETSQLLRSAPALAGLDAARMPQVLTARFAELVARRLRATEGETASESEDSEWPLTRIADAYELIISLDNDPTTRRAAAFVAATAQQIIAQETVGTENERTAPLLNRDRVDPSLAAALLFLAAEQYADANEAARRITIRGRTQSFTATLLAESIQDLAVGKLAAILERAERRAQQSLARGDLEARATTALFETLLIGVELLAAKVLGVATLDGRLGQFDSPSAAFRTVIELATFTHDTLDSKAPLLTTYPGPRHLAALLRATAESVEQAATTAIEPPPGVDAGFWRTWLRHHAASTPFIWPNHRPAIADGFHVPGRSAVMVLPTGAGKTTVACLKIAATLAARKSVIFIAPTHALVDQLKVDLQRVFPESLLQSAVSSDFDLLFSSAATLQNIEVMTPEHCLALLSYAPDAFDNVGLMVFDECHLLSPLSGLRRALDGMFCVLAFNSSAPHADFLFLSAMLRNGEEFAAWIGSLTGRDCVFVDPLWKPSRQARGVVLYDEEELTRSVSEAQAEQDALDTANGEPAAGVRQAAKTKLKVTPYALFGLQHNWLNVADATADCSIVKVSGGAVGLTGKLTRRRVEPTANVNQVAAHIAAASAQSGLKAIVFVNQKHFAVSTAREISDLLGTRPTVPPSEQERWDALAVELGGLDHALLPVPAAAVPHNSQMLRLERDIAERMFCRDNGAHVIVATPTLAQGLNLPAHLAVLAGDMRVGEDGGREELAAHELLNAAARAGRAGHLANGVVLLISERILTFSQKESLEISLLRKLSSILPEDDRCLDITDPLQVVLERISDGTLADPDGEYALNRLATAVAPEGAESEATTRFPIDKSLAAFMAARRHNTESFMQQVARLSQMLSERNNGATDRVILELSAQSGAPVSTLEALRHRLAASTDDLPSTILGWVSWVFDWLNADTQARDALLSRQRRAIVGAAGASAKTPLSATVLAALLPGVEAWVTGKSVADIERALGGNPMRHQEQHCQRARHLVTEVIPLSLTFVMGLVAGTAKGITESTDGSTITSPVLDCLPSAIRRGFDEPAKLAFADLRKHLLSRVQVHAAYAAEVGDHPSLEPTDDYRTLVRKIGHILSSA